MNPSDLFISTDVSLLNRQWVRDQIKASYWGGWRTDAIIEASMANSLCVGLYWRDPSIPSDQLPHILQLGFARVVSDTATFSWLCDVIIGTEYRGLGYGKFLVSQIMELPQVKRTVCYLATRDAHGLYERFGFERKEAMRRIPKNK